MIMTLKTKIFSIILWGLAASAFGQSAAKEISLPAPSKSGGSSIMEALWQRQSVRKCAEKELSLETLANLVWAANGINRPEDGKRTAPSAMNKQEIDIYVVKKEGAYKYIPKQHKLSLVNGGDFRAAVAGRQEVVKSFPVSIVLVADMSKWDNKEQSFLMAGADAGYVSQNICLYCAANGLATFPRGSMDKEALKKALKLNDAQMPLLNNPVGYK